MCLAAFAFDARCPYCLGIFNKSKVSISAADDPSVKLYNHGEGPYTRAFSWLKAPSSAFTFKKLC